MTYQPPHHQTSPAPHLRAVGGDGARGLALTLPALAELAQHPQWVSWLAEIDPAKPDAKPRKVLKNPTTGGNAMSNTPSTWADFHQATVAQAVRNHTGLGFVFSPDDPYAGADLDRCIDDNGEIKPLAQAIIQALATYAEISPSGTGVKLYCRGVLPKALKLEDIGDGIGLEIYDRGRWFAVTGQHVAGTPTSINDAQAALDDLYTRYAKPETPWTPPTATPRYDDYAPPSTDYPPAWVAAIAKRTTDTAVSRMTAAGPGFKHHARCETGMLLGGLVAGLDLIGYGHLLTADEAAQLLYTANPPAANQRAEWETITTAIAAGLKKPITIDKAPGRPPMVAAAPASPPPPGQPPSSKAPPTYTWPPVDFKTLPELPKTSIIKQCLYEDEIGDARLLKALYGDRLAFDHSAGQWYLWGGQHWIEDSTSGIRHLISAHVGGCYRALSMHLNTEAAKEEDEERKAPLLALIKALDSRSRALHKAARLNNVAALAEHLFGVTGDQWDAEPYLLAVENGVIDLRTGDLMSGKPSMYLRRVAPTEYRGQAEPAPRWEQFLRELFEPGGPYGEIPAYLARLFGYGLLGFVREAVLPVLYGMKGRNGKDTMLKTIKAVLGPYVGAMSNDVLISTGRPRDAGSASAHLMDLQGKRMVWASEPDEGQKFSVGQAKLLTGGGEINARAPHAKKAITFMPSHLMFLLTNHKPKAPSDDAAFWSRMQLVPFLYRFLQPHEMTGAANERLADPTLDATLIGEGPGILAWMVRGCLEYQRVGIRPPAVVLEATDEYREDEDVLADFLEACMRFGPDERAPAGPTYKAYEWWAIDAGMKPMSANAFGARMKERFEREKTRNGAFYKGIGLITPIDL